MGLLIFTAILVAITVYIVFIYNGLVTLKHNISKAWSNIDVLLKQRHDEIPKLVEVCKQYMQQEQKTLEAVMNARNQVASARQSGDVKGLGAAEGLLRGGLGSLFAVVENYPELQANDNFVHLRSRITSLENAISDRREHYNDNVNLNNIRIESFPDIIVARMLHFKPAALLEFSKGELTDPNVKALFE